MLIPNLKSRSIIFVALLNFLAVSISECDAQIKVEFQFDPPQIQRVAAPSKAEIRVASKTLMKLYPGFFDASTVAEARKAAATLFDDAKKTQENGPLKFQMLVYSQDAFISLVEPKEFQEVVDVLCKTFELDRVTLICDGFEQMAKRVTEPEKVDSFTLAIRGLVLKSIYRQEFSTAKKLNSNLQFLARRFRNKELSDVARDLLALTRTNSKIVEKYEVAKQTLIASPNDKDANQIAGEYFAVIEKDSSKAVHYFLKGNNEQISKTIETELANGPSVSSSQFWLSIGGKGTNEMERFFLRRSLDGFSQLVNKVSGVTKRKCELGVIEAKKILDSHLGNLNAKKSGPNSSKPVSGNPGNSITLEVMTTDKQVAALYDSASKRAAVVWDNESESSNVLGDAAGIEVDGNVLGSVTRSELSKIISDGKKHTLTVTWGAAL